MTRSTYLIIICCLIFQIAFGQCTEADADIWLNTWASCEKQENPMADAGKTHWIQYDLGAVRNLSKTWIWNTNDPSKLDQGFKRVRVDYSLDGEDWINWGEMHFPKGAGTPIYGGFSGPDLVGLEARYILLTALSNHGHPTCSGLAEVKFNLLPQILEEPISACNRLVGFQELEVEEVTETEAFIFWEYRGMDPYFIFQFRIEGAEDWTEIETEDFEIFLEDLKPGTNYEYQIGTECNDEIIFSDISTFTTLGEDVTTDTEDQIRNRDRLHVYPNPTRSQFTLSYYSEAGSDLQYRVLNTNGRVLIDQHRRAIPGNTKVNINLSSFPDGIYIIQTLNLNEGFRMQEKMIKIKD